MGDSGIARSAYHRQGQGLHVCTYRDGVHATGAVQPGKGRGFYLSGWVGGGERQAPEGLGHLTGSWSHILQGAVWGGVEGSSQLMLCKFLFTKT